MSTASGGHRAGDRIAEKYLLVRALEIGGMGSAWVAHHLALDVHVAIKLIPPESASAKAAARLLQAAQAAARVRHPAIVQVLDVGHTAEGEAYLAMELLDGETFADVLTRERRLDPATAIRVLLPIAEALDALHRSGSIHRDLKPENIFLTRSDAGRWQPKLIDFGLARSAHPGAGRITEIGVAMGAPAYVSYERLLGEEADLREDVYALSVILYQTMTGELPFAGVTPSEQISALTANRVLSTVDHGAGDAELWAIVKRGLARRSERWASAWDLGRALAGWAWKNGSLDDIAGMSLRPVWIDEEASRLDSPVSSTAPTVRLHAASVEREAIPPPPPTERPQMLDEIDDLTEDRSSDDAPPARPKTRKLTVLAASLAVLAIVSWSMLLVREARPEGPSITAPPAPGTEGTRIAPEPESATPIVTSAPPASASPAPPPSASAPAVTPTRRRETQARATPPRAPAPQPVKPAPKVESPPEDIVLKNPYD
jgi:eukaryotic-like serine/threonine-protein kinase